MKNSLVAAAFILATTNGYASTSNTTDYCAQINLSTLLPQMDTLENFQKNFPAGSKRACVHGIYSAYKKGEKLPPVKMQIAEQIKKLQASPSTSVKPLNSSTSGNASDLPKQDYNSTGW